MADAGVKARHIRAFTENRALARAVLIMTIAASILISGGSRLSSERAVISGIYTAQQGIYTDLAARAEAAYNLCGVAKDYPIINVVLINSVSDARDSLLEALKDAEARSKHSQINAQLDKAVAQLYSELSAAGLSDADAAFALKQYAEFAGRGAAIAKSEYNMSALKFNAKLRGFPANLISTITAVRYLDLYSVDHDYVSYKE
jgi:hypothetical protein